MKLSSLEKIRLIRFNIDDYEMKSSKLTPSELYDLDQNDLKRAHQRSFNG